MKKRFFISMLLVGSMLSACSDKQKKDSESNVSVAQEVKKEVLLQDSVSWNGDAVPAYLQGTPMCTVLKITVPPHSKLGKHRHAMMNTAIVVKGQLHVVDNTGKEITVKAGDTLLECVGREHYGENLTDEEVVLYVFYAGVAGQELSSH